MWVEALQVVVILLKTAGAPAGRAAAADAGQVPPVNLSRFKKIASNAAAVGASSN